MCMHTSAPGHIVDSSEFIWGIYTDIVGSYLYRGETAWLLLRFPVTEVFESVQLYLEGGFEMTIYGRHLIFLSTFIVQASKGESFKSIQ